MARHMDQDSTTILSITNWTGSKASNDPDGGIAALEKWLGIKAKRSIQASQRQGDVFQIQVLEKDKRSFLHVDGWRWAGVDIKVTEGQLDAPPRAPRNQSAPAGPRTQNGFGNQTQRNGDLSSRITGGPSNSSYSQGRNQNQQKELFANANPPSGPRGGGFQQNRQTNGNTASTLGQASSNRFGANQNHMSSQPALGPLEETLANVIRKRYIAAEKFLDLSALATDPDMQTPAIISQTADKVFSALFAVCENSVFETREKRAEMIESVSFKNNGLNTEKDIIQAGSTFYKIKNLDLSGNNFKSIRDISWWKNRFPDLEQIIMIGNPVDSPQTREEVKKWYRKLKTYNMQPVDAPFTASLQPQLENIPPVPTSSPAPGAGPNGEILSTAGHPEFSAGATFGLPMAGKTDDQLIKEQMGLKFSYETRLKMKWVEECLSVNNFDYDKAVADLTNAINNGNVPSDAFIQ